VRGDDGVVFTTDQVIRLTGISRRRLAYWLDHDILVADIDEARGRGHVRLWSFRNLLEVRVALWLRDKVSLQLIRAIVGKLRSHEEMEHPLGDVSFGVVETTLKARRQDVVIQRRDGSWEPWAEGQKVMEVVVPLRRFADELREAADADRRARRRVGVVERRRGALGSAPVLAGTRIPVATIRSLHEAGWSTERIVDNYPGLDAADVAAVLVPPERSPGQQAG
jgi:uncharacterized protein (DUF433 family)